MRVLVRASAIAMVLLALGLGLALVPESLHAAAAQAAPAAQKQQKEQKPPKTAQQKQQKPPAGIPTAGRLKREVRLVNIVFSVLNRKDHFVTDLTRKDFEIFDDNIPQQIQFFNRQTNLPLRIGILMDTSNSIHSRLKFEKNAAFDFLFRNLRPGKDQAFVMTFSSHPEIQQAFTDRFSLLRHAIFSQRAGGGTALYDAIYDACRDEINAPPPATGNDIRRVLVVISDGDDDLSDLTRGDAIEMAERAGVIIYTISTSNRWASPDQKIAQNLPFMIHYTHGDRVLQQLAAETGGRSFFPYRVTDLAEAFASIGKELRSQYSIAYTPTNGIDNGKFHRVHIEILHGNHLKIHARQGYWAEKKSPNTSSGSGR